MELELPENFPFEKPPKKGDRETFLVQAVCTEDPKPGEKYPWKVETIDGVPVDDTAGKANAPGDEGEEYDDAAEEAAETPEEEAAEGPEGEAEEMPGAETPAEADQGSQQTAGQAFASRVMKGE